jgi:hypothetical protein
MGEGSVIAVDDLLGADPPASTFDDPPDGGEEEPRTSLRGGQRPYEWARWLREALEADPFVRERLIVLDGWRDRGRPPPVRHFQPRAVVDHHTACLCPKGHDPRSCLRGIIDGFPDLPGPISQLLGTITPPGVAWNGSNVDPRVVLVAAGLSNHTNRNDRGKRPDLPRAAVSGVSIGIEWCGPLARWPDVVVELRARVTAAILQARGWPADAVTTHFEIFSGKIDPSGAWQRQPGLGRLEGWDPGLWRAEVARHLTAGARPAPVDEGLTAPSGRPEIATGATGPWVVYLQKVLVCFYPATPQTGVCDAATVAIIEKLQRANQLVVDGQVGHQQTWPVVDTLARRAGVHPPGA